MPQHPGQRQLGEALPAIIRDVIESAHAGQVLVGDLGRVDPATLGRTRIRWHSAVNVAVGEEALGQRGEHDGAGPDLVERREQPVFDVPVEHVVPRLVNRERNLVLGKCRGRSQRLFGVVVRNARVQRAARVDRGGERPHRLLDRCLRVWPVRVEDVDVVEAHPLEALVEGCQQVLARPPLAIWTRPHLVAGLGRNDELVTIRLQVRRVDEAEVRFCRTTGRAVIVREVEVVDAEIECAADYGPLGIKRAVGSKVVPEP